MDATHLTSTAPESDPTLPTLIPQPSNRRNLLFASAALLLLVGVWTSPQVLRPSVVSDISGGGTTALAIQHQVVTMVQLTPDGWPRVELQSVGDLPGARVAGAWVISGSVAQSEVMADPSDYPTGLAYLSASYPRSDFGAATRLPHRLDPGESAQLLILWDIADCTLLTEGRRPSVELGSILGSSTNEQLPDWASPWFALDADADTGNRICPAR